MGSEKSFWVTNRPLIVELYMPDTKLLSRIDIKISIICACIAPIALALSEEQLRDVAKKLAALVKHVKPSYLDGDYYQSVVGDRLPKISVSQICKEAIENTILERLYLLRCYRKVVWEPDVRATGLERIFQSLKHERGAIL